MQLADQNIETDETGNCVFIFACKPGGEASAVSTVALEFIQKLEDCALSDGSISFPSLDFFTWTPGAHGEFTAAFKEPVQFRPPMG